ncbi:phage protein [Aliivibrio fischeri]|uniref:Tail protein n=1 Tax=Aliivibrio fischeri TaxID=668 RepID=A0A510UF24_ALIFS|nr:phage protein [Aliivibrio fischeri]GEK13224.1 tail protein [Aliivibrio fischeri]
MSHGSSLSGLDVDVTIGDSDITVDKITLDIEDNSKASKSRGVNSGWLKGSVGAKGSLEVNTENFNRLSEEAEKAGSWRELPPFDFMMYAKTNLELKVEAFGCQLKITNLLDIDQKEGGDGMVHKLDYEVCGRDFIKINGTPILSSKEIEHLTRGS